MSEESGYIDVSDYAKAAKEAPVKVFGEAPDGTYWCVVDSIDFKMTQKEPSRPMLSWQYQVAQSANGYSGKIFKNNVFPTDASKLIDFFGYLKADFAACGVEWDGDVVLLNSQDFLAEVLDSAVEIKVKTKGEFTNVKVNRAVDLSATLKGAVAPTESDDDDLLF